MGTFPAPPSNDMKNFVSKKKFLTLRSNSRSSYHRIRKKRRSCQIQLLHILRLLNYFLNTWKWQNWQFHEYRFAWPTGKLTISQKKFVSTSQCLKITDKVSFNIASEASYVYILGGQKLIKNAKNCQFWKPEEISQKVLPDMSIGG